MLCNFSDNIIFYLKQNRSPTRILCVFLREYYHTISHLFFFVFLVFLVTK